LEQKKLDFEGLAKTLLGRARELLPSWLPGGKLRGHEFLVGNLSGEAGESLSININTGKWADFAADLKGGDLISLYAAINSIGQGDAYKRLAEDARFQPAGSTAVPATQKEERPIGRPPADAPPPEFKHREHGPAVAHWAYLDTDGSLIGYVSRHEPEAGKKQILPWAWDREQKRWRQWSFPKPRPLYGLHELAARPKAPVLIVEGEKAADAAKQFMKVYVVLTWPGGGKAVDLADWRPIYGRSVLLWPDADLQVADTDQQAAKHKVNKGDLLPYEAQPGAATMSRIAALLHGKCPEVKILNVGVDTDRADGWDAADALAAGMDWDAFVKWAKPLASVYKGAEVVNLAEKREEKKGDGNTEVKVPTSVYALWEQLGLALTQTGSPITNLDNALRILEGWADFKDIVWFDEFHHKFFTAIDGDPREWNDVDVLRLTAKIQRELGVKRMGDETIHKACRVYGRDRTRNEPREWMAGLKWDQVARIDEFFLYAFETDCTEYSLRAARNFWIGMVARIFHPGCQLDNMIVLEGRQGLGKTSALRAIGRDWYTEAHESVLSKDFYMALGGNLIVEIAELDAFSRNEVNTIKKVVSNPVDRYRAPYERSVENHPRMCVFAGTTNDDTYLKDPTGGRRFWPIRCHKVDTAYINEHRDQLFAEAVHRYRAGETWWEMPVTETTAEQEARRQHDAWEEVVEHFTRGMSTVTTLDVARDALKIDIAKLEKTTQWRIGAVMRALGWHHSTIRDSAGRPVKGWRLNGTERSGSRD
jgi:putative DNA primase/helicase